MAGRCVIVGAGPIEDYAALRAGLREEDYFIYCDGGLRHQAGLGREPDLIVGDFDSHPRPSLPVETLVLPREKDDTDSIFAAREALRRGWRKFLLLGVLGGRPDHSLANLALLAFLRDNGGCGRILGENCWAELVGPEGCRVEGPCRYFSLLAVDGEASGVDVEGARYPLRDARITWGYPYAVSNELLPGRCARVRVRRGSLLLIGIIREGESGGKSGKEGGTP